MKIARLLSSSFLVLAVALVAYGLFGFSRFAWYTGAYYDERMILFDHGFYPFAWGIALLLMGQIARLHHRRPAMLLAAGAPWCCFSGSVQQCPLLSPISNFSLIQLYWRD